MGNLVIKYGVISGVAAIILSLIGYLSDDYNISQYLSYAGMALVFGLMFKTVIDLRNSNSGIISFKDAFAGSWKVFAIYVLISGIFGMLLFNVIDPELPSKYMQAQIDTIENGSQSDEQKEQAIEMMKKFNFYSPKWLTLLLLFSLIIPGALFALIVALILKKEKNNWA